MIGWEGSLVCWFVGLCVGWLEGQEPGLGRAVGFAGWLVGCLLACSVVDMLGGCY